MIFGYARSSTGSQQITMEAQEAKLKAYCAYKDLKLDGIFKDAAQTSKRPFGNRPEGSKLEAYIKSGDCEAVVIAKLDRAFRNTKECLISIDNWRKKGVQVHILDINVDTTTVYGRVFLIMVAAFAEMERGLISERTSAALKHKAAAGGLVNHPNSVKYGKVAVNVKWDEDGSVLYCDIEDNPTEQAVIKKVLELRGKGLGYGTIAKHVTEAGFTNRLGNDFGRSTIKSIILRNS